MKKFLERTIIILCTSYFLLSWPIKRGTLSLPLIIMNRASDYVGAVYFENITLMNIIKYLLIIFCIVYKFLTINKLKIQKTKVYLFISFQSFMLYRILTLFLINDLNDIKVKVMFLLEFIVIQTLFYLVHTNNINTNKILKIIAYSNAFAIYIQFLFNIKNINSFLELRTYRFTGLVINSILVSIIIILEVIIIILENDKNKIIKSIFLIIACILTGSRTWIILVIVAVISYLFVKIGKKDRINYHINFKNIAKIIVITLSITIFSISYGSILKVYVKNYYVSMFKETSGIGENSPRDIKKNIAMNLFWQSPILGKGTGSYSDYQYQIIGSRSNPHNIYYEILCENGIIGIVLFIWFIICTLSSAIRERNILKFILLFCWYAVGFTIGLIELFGLLLLILILGIDKKNNYTSKPKNSDVKILMYRR